VRRKTFTQEKNRVGASFPTALTRAFARTLLLSSLLVFDVRGDEIPMIHSRFVGVQSCGSSSCHGSAAENRNQTLIWSKLDFHSRSYATLTTARSARLAETLHLTNAVSSGRCTACHAPMAEIPETERIGLNPMDGVSCENCHGNAEPWLRSHTRTDLSHGDRTSLGLRDLRDIYVRANTCVACHQNLDAQILEAGHPELIFELDGQAASQPRHWREKHDHGQLWLEGQAAALREMSAQLANSSKPEKSLAARWSGLLWVLQIASQADEDWPSLANTSLKPDVESAQAAWKSSDELARKVGSGGWSEANNLKILKKLAQTAPEFTNRAVPRELQGRRAERLVLALDRLTCGAVRKTPADAALDELFKVAQNLAEFDSLKFATALDKFGANSGLTSPGPQGFEKSRR
jgi:hypothetical protein